MPPVPPPPRRLRSRRSGLGGNLICGGVWASRPRHRRGDTPAPDCAPACAPRPQCRLRSRARGRMAQRLGERTRGPAEATGLYRAVLLRSGKWGQDHVAPVLGRARGGHDGCTASSLGQPTARRLGPSSLLCCLSLSFSTPFFHSSSFSFSPPFFFHFFHTFFPPYILPLGDLPLDIPFYSYV